MGARREFQQALRDRDIPALMRLSKVLFPADQQPKDERDALAMMHIARTGASFLSMAARSYSHFWCQDNGVPSMLPAHLLPKAERFRPTVKKAVGIALATGKEWLKPAIPILGMAMAKQVTDNAELIEGDPGLLRDKILFAKGDEFKRLFGALTPSEVER